MKQAIAELQRTTSVECREAIEMLQEQASDAEI